MQFTVTAQVVKLNWQNQDGSSFLYSIKDNKKHWSIWTKTQLTLGQSYTFNGYITESPDKKVKDQNGKAIYRAQFNAENVQSSDDIPF